MVTLVPFEPDAHGYDALVAASGEATRGRALEQALIDDLVRLSDGEMTRLVAVDDSGAVVGWAVSRTGIDYPAPGRRYLDLEVRPDLRGRKLGDRLLAAIGERTADGTESIVGFASAASRGALHLAERLGLSTADVVHDLRLELARLRPTQRALPDGVVARRLPDLAEDFPDWERRFYEMNAMAQREAPSHMEYRKPAFETWRKKDLLARNALPDAVVIALAGGEWVAMTELRSSAAGQLETHLTAVAPAYRRRGIAGALKDRVLAWAKAAGYASVKTTCARDNEGMLAINRAMGFEVVHTWHVVERELNADLRARWARGELPEA